MGKSVFLDLGPTLTLTLACKENIWRPLGGTDLKGSQLPTTLSSMLGFRLLCSAHLPWDIPPSAGPPRGEAPTPRPSSTLTTHPQGCVCLPASAEGRRQPWKCSHKTGLQRELFPESERKKYQPSTRGSPHASCLADHFPFPSLSEEPLCWSFSMGTPPVRKSSILLTGMGQPQSESNPQAIGPLQEYVS